MTLGTAAPPAATPPWLRAAALGGLAWNAYGAVQVWGSVRATPESLVALGLEPAVADVLLRLGDVTEGVFAAMGPTQVVVPILVVLIAGALLGAARRASAPGLLAWGAPPEPPPKPASPLRTFRLPCRPETSS